MNIKIVLLITTLLGVSSCTSCSKYYKINENEKLEDYLLQNKISFEKFQSLNENKTIDTFQVGEKVCIDGEADVLKFVFKSGDENFGAREETPQEQKIIDEKIINKTLNTEEKQNLEGNIKTIKDSIKDTYNTIADVDSLTACKNKCGNLKKVISGIENNPKDTFSTELMNKLLNKADRPGISGDFFYNNCISVCYNQHYVIEEIKKRKNSEKESEEINEEDELNELVKRASGRCGSKYGSCHSYYCCSKYGYCGQSDDYCGKGCQGKYGMCGSRGPSCPSISVKFYDNIGNGYKIPYYKKSDDDLRRRIDGCSSDLLKDLAGYLTPSCNGHDACYHCEKKETCDSGFKSNMDKICENKFDGVLEAVDYAYCLGYKNSAYQVVKKASFAKSGYDSDQKWPNDCKCTSDTKKHFVNKNFGLTN